MSDDVRLRDFRGAIKLLKKLQREDTSLMRINAALSLVLEAANITLNRHAEDVVLDVLCGGRPAGHHAHWLDPSFDPLCPNCQAAYPVSAKEVKS